MEKCFACRKIVWPWQKRGFNSGWHKKCTEIWEQGYDTAFKFCTNENTLHSLPTPNQLYNRRDSIGEMLPKEQWRGDQTIKCGSCSSTAMEACKINGDYKSEKCFQ